MSFFDELKRRSVIRVATLYVVGSWLILQVGDLIFDVFNVPSWGMRLLLAILILGFPVALLLSWAYELTSDGVVRDDDNVDESARRVRRRRLNVVIAVVSILAFAMMYLNLTVYDDSADAHSIAVMPFLNISDDPANEYFSDGLAEELLNLLAGIPELKVTARTSSFSFKNKSFDVPTIGHLLNVAHVLEGSVRKSDTHLRITAQLINVESGFHLWSHTYDRELDDIFAIQDEISAAVVDALRISLLGEAPRATETATEAYEAFLTALHFYQQRTNDGYEKAVDYTNRAIEIDPDYAPAWNLLGATYSNLALSGQRPYKEAHEQAMIAQERALEIDPDFALANSGRAWLAMMYERDYQKSAYFFRRARKLEPKNPIILGNFAILASRLGRVDEALELVRSSLVLNPVSSVGHSNLSDLLARAGRPVDAIGAAQKALELSPGNLAARVNLAAAYIFAEQPQRAIEEVENLDWRSAQIYIRALAYYSLGQTDTADKNLSLMVEQFADTAAFSIATVYAWRRATDEAFAWLDRAVDEDQQINGIRSETLLNTLHDDARWNPILESIGLSDEQVAAVRF